MIRSRFVPSRRVPIAWAIEPESGGMTTVLHVICLNLAGC